MAQRLVRAKGKIRAAGIPYEVPGSDRLAERLDGVLRVVYLVFNEGYAATSGDALRAPRAVRRGDPPRAPAARAAARGRARWPACSPSCCCRTRGARRALDAARRAGHARGAGPLALGPRRRSPRGWRLAEEALRRGGAGFYALQAAIAALHAQAARAEDTDWPQIAALYALLLRLHPSPVVALNHAAAVAMGERPERGLRLIEQLEATGELARLPPAAGGQGGHPAPARAPAEAAAAYEQALRLVTQDAERRYLERRLREVRSAGRG